MTPEQGLQLLVQTPRLTDAQLLQIIEALTVQRGQFDDMDWSDQRHFIEVYDAALRLIIVRLRAGRDSPTARVFKGVCALVQQAPFDGPGDGERYVWMAERARLDPDAPPSLPVKMASRLTTISTFALLQYLALRVRSDA